MKENPPKDPRFGCVSRSVREGDRIHFSRDGESLGFIEIQRVPHDSKIRIAIAFDRSILIERREETP